MTDRECLGCTLLESQAVLHQGRYVCPTCLSCLHAKAGDKSDMKRNEILRKMAEYGLLNCAKSLGRASFHTPNGTCHLHEAAKPEVVARRIEWAKRLETGRNTA